MDRWGVPKQPNAALFLPELEIRRKWWGGPPGPRGTPPSRCRNNDISTLQGVSGPTGASAADPVVRPTKQVRLSVAGKVCGITLDRLLPTDAYRMLIVAVLLVASPAEICTG
jgi:hypothetical protein